MKQSYDDWFKMLLSYIKDRYACTVKFPFDINSYDMKDGLTLSFYNIQWDCFLSNYQLHTIYYNARNPFSSIKSIRDIIGHMLESEIYLYGIGTKAYKKEFRKP